MWSWYWWWLDMDEWTRFFLFNFGSQGLKSLLQLSNHSETDIHPYTNFDSSLTEPSQSMLHIHSHSSLEWIVCMYSILHSRFQWAFILNASPLNLKKFHVEKKKVKVFYGLFFCLCEFLQGRNSVPNLSSVIGESRYSTMLRWRFFFGLHPTVLQTYHQLSKGLSWLQRFDFFFLCK